MPESSVQDLAPNIHSLIARRWSQAPDKVVARYADVNNEWIDITAGELSALVDSVAKGLVARGVKIGERVGIMSRTRYEWTVLDVALWSIGAIPVPIYDTSSSDQVNWITSDAEVSLLFVENDHHRSVAAAVLATESPLSTIEVIDEGALEALVVAGRDVSDDDLAARRAVPTLEDLATIIYTSGTTGRPKGVLLNHFHFVRHDSGIEDELHEVLFQEGASTILFLTLAHSFARLIQVVFLSSGIVIGYCPDTTKLVDAMSVIRPTLIVAVPRVFEKVYNSAEQKAAASGKVKIFRWAAKQGIEYSQALDSKAGPSAALKFRYKIAYKLVLHKIAEVLGGRATWAISGSAPLGERLGRFYHGLGLRVLEGYGLTETTAAATVNRPALSKIGSVGKPLPGIEAKVAEDGEILMRGDLVFAGYHRNDEATRESFRDGWLMSGDIGSIDEDGYIFITGRKKEIIVTAGGKNVAPAVLEDRLRAYPLVAQCVVVGDGKPFIGALITLDAEALPGWLKGKGMPALTVAEAAKDDTIREHMQRAVERANEAVSRAESIRKFEILVDDFTVENDYLTPSMKVKRSKVLKDYAPQIDALYEG